tara:strand:+ start:3504 stop:3749 length:246 start_codon:yes stop_codon:yes gene_type:complete
LGNHFLKVVPTGDFLIYSIGDFIIFGSLTPVLTGGGGFNPLCIANLDVIGVSRPVENIYHLLEGGLCIRGKPSLFIISQKI